MESFIGKGEMELIVAATRLHLRHAGFVLPLFAATWRIGNQVCRAEGFRGGRLLKAPGGVYWTLTTWDDAEQLDAFRNTGPHAKFMPYLSRWCSDAAFARWEVPGAELPTWSEVAQRLAAKAAQGTAPRSLGSEIPPGAGDPRRGYLSLSLVPARSILSGLLQIG
jgi:heme-degrading monooxygenase HmoA